MALRESVERHYEGLSLLCVLLLVTSAIVFDFGPLARVVSIAVGVLAALLAAGLYAIRRQPARQNEELSEKELVERDLITAEDWTRHWQSYRESLKRPAGFDRDVPLFNLPTDPSQSRSRNDAQERWNRLVFTLDAANAYRLSDFRKSASLWQTAWTKHRGLPKGTTRPSKAEYVH